ncbi:MAG: hypothetical protein N2485_08810 [bacterium]|nr:hypothetical protein [bacterium]
MQPQVKYEVSVVEKGKFYDVIKRIIDIIGGLVGIILFSPLYLFLIIAIKCLTNKFHPLNPFSFIMLNIFVEL